MADNYLVKNFSEVCTQHGRGKMISFYFFCAQTVLDPAAGLVRSALAEVKGNF